MLLADGVDDRVTLNIIMYELLHIVSGYINHNSIWKVYAEYIIWKLPQYNIRRVATKSDSCFLF